ncbi:electron transport complex subunit RsxE [Leptotrichia sp. OH3620_COT-345]|uniref:electron transport complex subunit RsxE n=1 Tax=Leptotrichia sp. OH3620_COT-345 TaxID=2491048 RepID=UPI000F650900|nr:electron transport complex subunit RsxE [Leptotrichia sp. OH3620_COT-345]RRD41053.1 electron transport complex subunit RsxE [Leptotrichia sp. OH3620_COT-345]
MKKIELIKSGIIKENPVFVMFLGTCPILATTNSLTNAVGMTAAFTVVLIITNTIISAMRKIVPDQIRIPVYIVVIATAVKFCEMMLNAYALPVYESLGVFLALIVVNCIVLGRAEAFASKNTVTDSFMDAIGVSIGFGISLIAMSAFREILGTGELQLKSLFDSEKIVFQISMFKNYGASFFTSGAGAFLSFGLLAGLFNIYKNKPVKKDTKKKGQVK